MHRKMVLLDVSVFLMGIIFLYGCNPDVKNLSAQEKQGYELYKEICRQCHRLQNPKMHTPDEWEKTVEKMQRYMEEKKDRVTLIDEEQKEKILLYLKKQSRRSAGG